MANKKLKKTNTAEAPKFEVAAYEVQCALNIRQKPDGEIVKVLNAGDKVMVSEVVNGWANIGFGWCMIDYLVKC